MPNAYELKITYHNGAGNFFENVLHYVLEESGALNPFLWAQALVQQWVTDKLPDWLLILAQDVIVDLIECKRASGTGGPTYEQAVGSPGLVVDNSFSSGVALDIGLVPSGTINRWGHVFIGAVPITKLVKDVFDAAYLTGPVQNVLDQLLIPMTLAGSAGTAGLVIYHRKTKTWDPPTLAIAKPKATMLNKRTLIAI